MMKTIVIAIVCALAACGPGVDCKDPANASTAECSVIDCTKGELPQVISEVGPLVGHIIEQHAQPDGKIDWTAIESKLASLGSTYGACILGSLLKQQEAPKGVMATKARIAPADLRAGFEHARTSLWHLPPTTKIHTANGDL